MKELISVWGMKSRAKAHYSDGQAPLGGAKWSPQDFTLFLINYSGDLSANVREVATLDNT